jgi:hypothetical protein
MLIFVLAVTLSLSARAQSVSLPPTKAVRILGKVKNPITIDDIELKKYPVHSIGDVNILNAEGEVRKSWKELSGIRLKDLLDTVSIDTENHSQLGQYFFVCQSIDGSKVVFSWNEVFNTPSGENIYLVSMRDDQPMEELNESILLIATQDLNTSLRYLRNLESIRVERTE